jgi:hypothetical protein
MEEGHPSRPLPSPLHAKKSWPHGKITPCHCTPNIIIPYSCSQQCRSQEEMHMPRWVLWFIFNLRKQKNLQSVIRLIMSLQLLHTMFIFLLTVQTAYTYILERPGFFSAAVNKSILAPLSKQNESSYSSRDFGDAWTASHASAVAWIFQLGLLRSCCWSKSQILDTYKSHRYTS